MALVRVMMGRTSRGSGLQLSRKATSPGDREQGGVVGEVFQVEGDAVDEV